MRRLVLFCFTLFVAFALQSCFHKSVNVEDLPVEIAYFIDNEFYGEEIMHIQRDWCDYQVVLSDGTHIPFSSDGDWKEMSSADGVSLSVLPYEVSSTIEKMYGECVAKSIEHDGRYYEIELFKGIEYTISEDGQIKEID